MTNTKSIVLFLISAVFAVSAFSATAETEKHDYSALKLLATKGHFALIRHALAPGTGDPENFTLGDRQTQRNLSTKGREQAAAIGNLLKANGINKAAVY